MENEASKPELAVELEDLRTRLAEAEEVLRAIRSGEVDALVVAGERGDQVYTLSGADRIYRQLIETMSEGAATLSADGDILYGNACLAKTLRRPLDQVLGTALRNYLPPADQEAFDSVLRQARTAPACQEIRLQTSEGRLVPVYLSATLLRSDGAEPVFCLVLTDLTEQKRQEEIVAAERLARSILEQAAEAIVVCDDQGRVIRASQAAQRLCPENPLLRLFTEAFPLRSDGPSPFSLAPVLQGETLNHVEVELERQGQPFVLLLNAGPLLGIQQQKLGCVVTLTDITERKRAAEALREVNENLDITLKSIGDGVISTDLAGKIVRMNPVAETLTNWALAEAAGRPLTEVFRILNGQTRQPVADPVGRVLEIGQIVGLGNHTVLIARDGTERQIADCAAPMRDAAGQMRGVVLIFRDVTEEYAAAEALRQQTEALRVRNEELTRFNRAVVGRELRMIELKQEVDELCRRLVEPPRYGVEAAAASSGPASGGAATAAHPETNKPR